MKKLLITLVLASILCFNACASSDSSTTIATDSNGNCVYEYSGLRTTMIDSLPCDLKYNDSTISLVDVRFFENVSNYSHNLFIVATLDIHNLSEDQVHWLRESDLDINVYITNEKNDYDFENASYLGSIHYTDTEQLIFVYTSSFLRENRYSFGGSDISLTVTATQEETFEYTSSNGTTSNLHKSEELHYCTTTEDSITDAENIEKPLYNYVAEWLYKKANSY